MRVPPVRLESQLAKGLAPIYMICGDEPLQLGECADAVRLAAREQGFASREVLTVERNFDWGELLQAADSMSLFSEQRIIDLRLQSASPGAEGSKALVAYAQRPPEATLLLITAGKIDKKSQGSKWFKALDSAGLVVQVWPIEGGELIDWINRRMGQRGLKPSQEGAQLLADRVAGNLLAAAQEIDKLLLLHGEGEIGSDEIYMSVADSARYDIFGFVDSLLLGEIANTPRMVAALRAEGVEITLLIWVLAREARALAQMAYQIGSGERAETVFARSRPPVWDKRKPVVRAALKRHGVKEWQWLLSQCATLDRIAKGVERGDAWEELLRLSLQIGGLWLPQAALKPRVASAPRMIE